MGVWHEYGTTQQLSARLGLSLNAIQGWQFCPVFDLTEQLEPLCFPESHQIFVGTSICFHNSKHTGSPVEGTIAWKNLQKQATGSENTDDVSGFPL